MVEKALTMLKADLKSPNDCKAHMVQLALSIVETQSKKEKLVLEMNKVDAHMTSLMLQYRDLKTDKASSSKGPDPIEAQDILSHMTPEEMDRLKSLAAQRKQEMADPEKELIPGPTMP